MLRATVLESIFSSMVQGDGLERQGQEEEADCRK